MMTKNRFRRTLLAGSVAFTMGAALLGCSSDSESATSAAAAVSVTDAWAKAADTGMTAVFGTLANSSGSPVTLTSVDTAVSPRVELHEMASDGAGSMSMREKEGGFEIPARGEQVLEPGGEHIMLFDLTAPVRAGTRLPLTLTFSDGSTAEIEAQVRDFTGAKEEYSEQHGG
ncbi:copper chaperone PCu(A)C [Rhodococcus sp. NPDC003322]